MCIKMTMYYVLRSLKYNKKASKQFKILTGQ